VDDDETFLPPTSTERTEAIKKMEFLPSPLVMNPDSSVDDSPLPRKEDEKISLIHDPSPSESFWKECDQAENLLARKIQVPATPSKRKKNHARRERREPTRKRLAEEQIKEEERRARIRRREELRERRRNSPAYP
jgi:hypothetical protein